VLGLGFAAGGVTVLYKRIGNWLNLLQFGFVVLVAAPVFDAPWTRFLPLAHGSALLQRAMVDGVRLWAFGPVELGLLVAVAVGYLAGGTSCSITRRGAPGDSACWRLLTPRLDFYWPPSPSGAYSSWMRSIRAAITKSA